MRALLLLLIVSLSCCGATTNVVLTLVDSTLYSDAGVSNKIAEWKSQVEREGYFRIYITTVARVRDRNSTNRLSEIAAHRALLGASNYCAVHCWGAVAMGISGWINPDGHASRPFDTDMHLIAPTSYTFADVVNAGSTSGGTNNAGDGIWDENAAPFIRPVSRVSFHDLGLMDTGTVWPAGCYAGTYVAPSVNETNAMIEYINRNLEYRRGVRRISRTGYIVGGLWSTVSGSVEYATNGSSPVTWTYSTDTTIAAGKKPLFLWNNCAVSEISLLFDDTCAWPEPVWVNTYRSFMMEPLLNWADMYIRRWLQHALVSTWGPNWWQCPAASRTIFDAQAGLASALGNYWVVWAVCWGDGTLPVIRIPPHASTTIGRVGSIQRR